MRRWDPTDRRTTVQTAIALYPGLTILDVIGPYQVLSMVPGNEVVLCAAAAGRLSDDQGLVHLEVEHTFADVPEPDVVLVGGGLATRRLMHADSDIVRWLAAADAHTAWTTSVCTGSLLLGAAGLLDGRRATTHWNAVRHLESFGATYSAERVVTDGKVVTGAGVSAGIDLALTLVGLLQGDDVARAVQLGIEYDPRPPYDAGSPATAPPEIVEVVAAVMDDAEQRLISGPA
jgi:transcriptional regulator GlxA family with amidase domain